MDSRASQSISDDQELAKVLAGVSQDTDNNLQFEETSNIVDQLLIQRPSRQILSLHLKTIIKLLPNQPSLRQL